MLSQRYHRLSALILLLLPCVAFAGSVNDPPNTPYRSTSSEVRISFFATDGNNHPVGALGQDELRQDDFVIVDDGMVIRNFRSLMRSDETALDVVVMVDASESVAGRFQATMRNVLQLIAQNSGTNDHNLSVVSFAGLHSAVVCTEDCRSAIAKEKLLSVMAVGATPLYEALAYSADFISARHTAGVRPVLLLFSDGQYTISKISAHQALQAVIASGALLYAVDVGKPGDNPRASALLQRMAESTGGRYFSGRENAASVLQAALDDLRASYVVSYRLPSRAIGFHSLRILPKQNLNLQFHCRGGYYYPTNP